MFDEGTSPRVFAMPPGADFPKQLVVGLTRRMAGRPPEDMARVELIVNTRRMARRIQTLFSEGPALLMPRIRLVTELGEMAALDQLPAAVAPLRRRLELATLVERFVENAPDFAPRSAIFDLADSLAKLLAEMQSEGVDPERIASLDVEDQSGHWQRTQRFLSIVQHYFDEAGGAPDAEGRQRRIIEHLSDTWAETPPGHPVILAGSTGSRGATLLLMKAVAKLPQGALILPGFDPHLPAHLWRELDDALLAEDHPQYRFHALMRSLEIDPTAIKMWEGVEAPSPARNALISLSLRPAPVTDQWLQDGPALGPLEDATHDMTLLQAPSLREEAFAIALRLRKAAEDGQTAALITPDRMLTRQVTAALDRWGIRPDDSAGQPLPLSPVGRLLRHVAALFEDRLSAESLLTLLKHPLTHSGSNRGIHLLLTRDLELHLRRYGPPYPEPEDLLVWVAEHDSPDAPRWGEWLCQAFATRTIDGAMPLSAFLETHISLVELIVRGSDQDAVGHPWAQRDGKEARRLIDQLADAADAGGPISARDYADMFGSVLALGDVREVETPHPHILIWGTLEARVQGADLLILGGLNEGSWPAMPSPDPWLNRKMRHQAGLLLPERNIGLSAHDYQQAVAAPEVWLTRSLKSDDAQTVPSRWLNRLANLLRGLPEQGGQAALESMEQRGSYWLGLAAAAERAEEAAPAKRPAPCPPVDARPRRLTVTEIKRLIRDPYAIYAKHVLRLRPLDPLMRTPDAMLRGTVLHRVVERFIDQTREDPAARTAERLVAIAGEVIEAEVPWPVARLMWLARIERIAENFARDEAKRAQRGSVAELEVGGSAEIPALKFTLSANADRIDITEDGRLLIYDYKTGKPPSSREQQFFDKQLMLEAAIAEIAGFGDIGPRPVMLASYIGMAVGSGEVPAPMEAGTPRQVWQEFEALIGQYLDQGTGYSSRRALQNARDAGDYDHLARFGEWSQTDDPVREVLT